MIIRLVSSQSFDGEAVIIPENWASHSNSQEVRAQVRNNVIDARLAPGQYNLFLNGTITPRTFSVTDLQDEVSISLPDTAYRIVLKQGDRPAAFQEIIIGSDVTITLRSDESGIIMLKEDPRPFMIETSPGVTACIEQV